ncbi:amidohydrolase [Colletotrichum graminicola]|nr:amidohydrolase [Colletotrichum graminicola]
MLRKTHPPNSSTMERIDIHCHAVPAGYRQYALDNGHEKPDGMPALPDWTPEEHIALMKSLNISKSILSITSPGTHLTPNQDRHAAGMTRQTNEELAAICKQHPSHFGFFASLPLPSVQESVAEMDYALDVLGAVGFAVMSNASGVYLGDRALDPIFERLHQRKAILFIHPTTCNLLSAGGQVQPMKPLEEYPRPMMEFMFDETRAIANLLLSSTVSKYPGITFIMSHGGCVLPSIVDRIGAFATFNGGENRSEEFRGLLRERFFFDMAGFPFPDQVHGLLRTLGQGGERRLVYGSDYPFTPGKVVLDLGAKMDQGCKELFDEDQRQAVYSGNAERMLRQL